MLDKGLNLIEFSGLHSQETVYRNVSADGRDTYSEEQHCTSSDGHYFPCNDAKHVFLVAIKTVNEACQHNNG